MSMEPPPLPLSGRLREAVGPIHERIERLPFFAALSARTLPLERYVDQLRAMAIVEATVEYRPYSLLPRMRSMNGV